MNFRKLFLILLLPVLTLAPLGSLERSKTLTCITVVAYEYYDEYQLPDCKDWRQVESIRIEGEGITGSKQVLRDGPSNELEVMMPDVSVPSEYVVTVTWQGGEQFRETYTAQATDERVHRIHQPF